MPPDVDRFMAELDHPLEAGIELLDRVAPDRAVVPFRDLDDVAARQAAVVDVVNGWEVA